MKLKCEDKHNAYYESWRVKVQHINGKQMLFPGCTSAEQVVDFKTRKTMREGKAILKRVYGDNYTVKTYAVTKIVDKETGCSYLSEEKVY